MDTTATLEFLGRLRSVKSKMVFNAAVVDVLESLVREVSAQAENHRVLSEDFHSLDIPDDASDEVADLRQRVEDLEGDRHTHGEDDE